MIGVTFHGIHSSSLLLNMVSDNRGIFPTATRKTVQVPLLHGSVDFEMDTYDELSQRITFSYNFHNDTKKLREFARDVRGWLYNDGKYYDLIFDDEPDRKYRAKVVAAVDLSQTATKGSFTVEFICNPPYQLLLNNTPVTGADEQARLLWDTATLDATGCQYTQTFSANGTMRFTVAGASPVKPIIKLIGYIPSGLTLTYGTTVWMYNAEMLYDGIKIDCALESVTRMSDDANMFGNVNATYNDYFELAIGQQSIAVYGVSGAWPKNLTVAVEFAPQE